jgi:hypothetical protein
MFDYDDPNDTKAEPEIPEQPDDAISDDQLDEATGAGEYWGGEAPSDGV